MRIFSGFFVGSVALLGVSILPGALFAQNAAPAPAAEAEKPQLTTATFDDWTVSCRIVQNERACEMTQVQTIKGQKNPVGQITFAKQKPDAPVLMVIQIPPSMWLETGIKLAFTDTDGLSLTTKWCAPSRCFAQIELTNDQIAKLKARSEAANIQYKEASQRDVVLPVSFKGFAPAFEAMQKK